MTAKEMFEELGYKCIHYSVNSNIKWIAYQLDGGLTETKTEHIYKNIDFNKYRDEPLEVSIDKTYKNIITERLKCELTSITDLEVKAINKQVEEMGWNNEQNRFR